MPTHESRMNLILKEATAREESERRMEAEYAKLQYAKLIKKQLTDQIKEKDLEESHTLTMTVADLKILMENT